MTKQLMGLGMGLVLAGLAQAHGEHSVKIEIHGGQVVASHLVGSVLHHDTAVFGASFGPGGGTDEPGLHALPATFRPGTSWSLDLIAPVQRWTGSGFGPTDATIEFEFGGQSISYGALPVRGLEVTSPADGGFHIHPSWALDGEAGIYLLQLRLRVNEPSIAPSAPLYLVFNSEQEASEHLGAITFVEDAIVGAMHFHGAQVRLDGTLELEVHVATPGAVVWFLAGLEEGTTTLPMGGTLALSTPRVVGLARAIGDEASLVVQLPPALAARGLHFQAYERVTGRVSNWVSTDAGQWAR